MSNNIDINKDNKLILSTAINGSISSFISTFLTYPIDTIKSRLQSNIYNTPLINKKLYNGLRYDMFSVIPSSFTYWYSYSYLRKNNYGIIESSCTASILSSIIDTPLDIYKKRVQLNMLNHSNIINYGCMNILGSFSFNLFYLKLFKTIKEKTNSDILALTSASLCSGLISYPFDRKKTMIIVNNYQNNNQNIYNGLKHRLIYCFLYSLININILLYLNKDIS